MANKNLETRHFCSRKDIVLISPNHEEPQQYQPTYYQVIKKTTQAMQQDIFLLRSFVKYFLSLKTNKYLRIAL